MLKKALLAEFMATWLFLSVIFGCAVDKRGKSNLAPLLIGLTISVNVTAIGPISGSAVNPARGKKKTNSGKTNNKK